MVPADSRRISRVPRYSGAASPYPYRFAYGAFTLCGHSFQSARLRLVSDFAGGPTTPVIALPQCRFGLLRFRSPLLSQSLLFSFPPGTEMFQFPGFAPVSDRYPCGWVAPFGNPRVVRVFAPYRGLSQLVTSFFASKSLRHPSCALASFLFSFILS